jgi:hypothetical protein
VDPLDGRLRRLRERFAGFGGHARGFLAALENDEQVRHRRPAMARAQPLRLARALLARGTAGNTQKARTLLSASLATYRELGMHARVAGASALAAESGAATR